jgi:hypothetical protein
VFKVDFVPTALAGVSLGAFILAELGVSNTLGWTPTHLSAIYLALASIAVSLIRTSPRVR